MIAITNALSFSKKDMAENTEYADEDEQEEEQLELSMWEYKTTAEIYTPCGYT